MVNFLVNIILGEQGHAAAGNADTAAAPSPAARTRAGLVASIISICCNVALCTAKALIGLAAGSVSIVADAVNNLSDAASNIVSLIGFKLASKPADTDHPYGHGRFEYLAGLVVAVIVCSLGLNLVKESIGSIVAPQPSDFSPAVAAVLVASMAVKLWMMFFNHALGRRIDSETLMACAADSRNDVLTTGAVLACAIISWATGVNLDGWAGLAVGGFIAVSGLGLIRDTLNPLLGCAPTAEYIDNLRRLIMAHPGVLGTHDLMVHDYGPGRVFASAHVQMDGHADAFKNHQVIDAIEREFAAKTGAVLTLHYDPVDTSDDDPETWLAREVAQIDGRLSVHDLYLGDSFMSFDLVVPAGCGVSDDEALTCARAIAAKRWPQLPCVVALDRGFLAGA